jgi:hypothetical protein
VIVSSQSFSFGAQTSIDANSSELARQTLKVVVGVENYPDGNHCLEKSRHLKPYHTLQRYSCHQRIVLPDWSPCLTDSWLGFTLVEQIL